MALHILSCEDCPDETKADRLTSEAFRAALANVGHGVRSFAAFTGTNPRTVRRWAEGSQDIAAWVGPMLTLMDLASTAPRSPPPRRSSAQFIHHADGDPTNNDPGNLVIVDREGKQVG